MEHGGKEDQTTTFNKYAFACAVVASMVSIISGYGNIAFSLALVSIITFFIAIIISRIFYYSPPFCNLSTITHYSLHFTVLE